MQYTQETGKLRIQSKSPDRQNQQSFCKKIQKNSGNTQKILNFFYFDIQFSRKTSVPLFLKCHYTQATINFPKPPNWEPNFPKANRWIVQEFQPFWEYTTMLPKKCWNVKDIVFRQNTFSHYRVVVGINKGVE